MNKWCLYILECSNNTLYTGVTNDLERRFDQHKSGKGAMYTRFFTPTKILYTEKHLNRSKAQKRESEIKKWDRKKKLALISDK